MSTTTYREGLSGQEIRLLRLLPGKWIEDLAAELYVADQDQDYVALSYAWGSTRRSNKIIVNRHVHLITFNLDRALRAIRRTTESIVIWVDSVCINQEDAAEKSHQVGLMHDIFGSATEVIAYVGDGLDRSRQDYPQRFARLGLSDPVRFTGKPADLPLIERYFSLWKNSTPGSLSEHEEMLCLYSVISGQLHETFTHPTHQWIPAVESPMNEWRLQLLSERMRRFAVSDWWNRIWIIQEACVARELTITYGRVSMPFNTIGQGAHKALSSPSLNVTEFAKVVSFLADKAGTIDFLRVRASYRPSSFTINSPLLWLLRKFRNKRSSEPRDKIFALLRLAHDLRTEKIFSHAGIAIDTDYEVSIHTLFSHVAHEIIKETGILWVTTFDLLAKTRNDMPSWVPDWSSDYAVPGWSQHRIDLHEELFHMFNASNARFVHSKGEGSEDLYVLPQQHFRHLAHKSLDDDSTWRPVHHLPAEVPQHEEQGQCVLSVSGFRCGYVSAVSQPIANDLSNVGEVAAQILSCYSLPWALAQSRRHTPYFKPFSEVLARILCFSMKTQCRSDGYDSPRWLQEAEEKQLSYWILFQTLSSSSAVVLSSSEFSSANFKDDLMFWKRNLPDGHEISLRIAEAPVWTDLLYYSWVTSSPEENHTGGAYQRPRLFTFTHDFINQHYNHGDDGLARMLLEDKVWIEDTVKAVASGSRLFITNRGQLGLGPEKMRFGDLVYILDGGLMPHILRKRPRIPGVIMVGTCYVEGLMHWGSESGNYADNANDTEGLEHKLRRQLRDLGISREYVELH